MPGSTRNSNGNGPSDVWDADRDFEWLLAEEARIAEAVSLQSYDQGGGWEPVQLNDVVDGLQAGYLIGPTPTLMKRTDGVALLYPGQVHGIAGEPESGKGWMVLAEAALRLRARQDVLYLDFEDSPLNIVDRLLRLGAPAPLIKRHLTYVRPEQAFKYLAFRKLLRAAHYSFAVIDGVTDAFELLNLDINDNKDAARFRRTVSVPIAKRGAATVEVDHVTKATDGRGRYAIGAQKKLVGVAVQYKTEVVVHPTRMDPGHVKLHIEKDRHGRIRGYDVSGVIAEVRITPHYDGSVSVLFDQPEQSQGERGDFRPTALMANASQWIAKNPGRSTNDVVASVGGGNRAQRLLAINNLIADEYVRVEPGPRRAHLLHAIKPYTQDFG